MVKFCLLLSLFLLSSRTRTRGSTQIASGFDGSMISVAFDNYNPSLLSNSHQVLDDILITNYEKYPIESLTFIKNHQDWAIKVAFWQVIEDQYITLDISRDREVRILGMIHNILRQIQMKFLKTYTHKEEKEIQFKSMRIMIELIEDARGQLTDESRRLIWEVKDNYYLWYFLFENLSYNFENNTIDYESLLNTFSKITLLVDADPKNVIFNEELQKQCSLFITYIAIIGFQGDQELFNFWDPRRAPVIYLIQELNWET